MEVKPGYKRTEVGIVPEDWEVKSLGEVGEVLIGLTYEPADVCQHGTLVLRSSNIQNDALAFDDNVFVDRDIPERIRVQMDDVLICVRNGSRDLIGKSALLDERAKGMTFGAFMAVYRSQAVKLASYLFQSAILKRQINEHLGATINQITNKSLKSFRIPVPRSEAEQSAIAQALHDVDGLLGGLDQLIAKKRDLKQAAMQQLLTGETRLPGFDGAWKVKRLKTIVQTPVTDGPHLTPQFLDDGIPFLSVNNLVDNRIDLTDLRYISLEDHEVFSRKCKPRKNDILLGKAASVGKVALVGLEIEFNIWSPIAMVRINCDNSPCFVYYQLQSQDLIRQIALLTNSSSQGNIGMGDIERLTLNLPVLAEQTAIAEVLSDMDAELVALAQRREKTSALKQAMMQELLIGNTRLVSPQEPAA